MYALQFETKGELREAITKINRLRGIFVGTRDENEINELVVQLERILSDMGAWETSDVSVERLEEVLTLQIEHQLAAFQEFLEAKEIDPAWDIAEIYQALMSKQLDATRRRSKEWIQPRLELAQQISSLDRQRCAALEKELAVAPTYLTAQHVADVKQLRESVQNRIAELDELERITVVADWQQRYLKLVDIKQLGRHTTEELLQDLLDPPCQLRQEERAQLTQITNRLTAHLDQMSMDELFTRIERLSESQQHLLLTRLSTLLEGQKETATEH
ncbi:MAG: hypothetical protein RNU03_10260 [Candidatus Sedimenticola sp. (ex Thyasira tokunagai)]